MCASRSYKYDTLQIGVLQYSSFKNFSIHGHKAKIHAESELIKITTAKKILSFFTKFTDLDDVCALKFKKFN